MTVVVNSAKYDFSTCTKCNGSGTLNNATCIYCEGTGRAWIADWDSNYTFVVPNGIKKAYAEVGNFSSSEKVSAIMRCTTTGETWLATNGAFEDPLWWSYIWGEITLIPNKSYTLEITGIMATIWSNEAINN